MGVPLYMVNIVKDLVSCNNLHSQLTKINYLSLWILGRSFTNARDFSVYTVELRLRNSINRPTANRFIRLAIFIPYAHSECVIPINAHCPRISLARRAQPRRENGYLSKSYPEETRNQYEVCI